MPLARLEKIKSNETVLSIDDDTFFYIVREGNLCFNCSNIFFMIKQCIFTCTRDISNLYTVQLCACVFIQRELLVGT
jgi:hypothetical protein